MAMYLQIDIASGVRVSNVQWKHQSLPLLEQLRTLDVQGIEKLPFLTFTNQY
jgi:hypothetical protein